jgi:hypothetical protein
MFLSPLPAKVSGRQVQANHHHVDELDADKRHDHAA